MGCHSAGEVSEIRDGKTLPEKQAEAVPISNGVNGRKEGCQNARPDP